MIERESGATRSTKFKVDGFTIIEVIIVLAIVSLIILIVFIAVPTLRKNSSNHARRNDAARLASLVNDFMIANGGSQPLSFGTGPGQLDITDERWAIVDLPQNYSINTSISPNYGPTINVLIINFGFRCENGLLTQVGGSEFAIGFKIDKLSGEQDTCLQG